MSGACLTEAVLDGALKEVLFCAQPRDAELRKLDLLLTRLVAL